MKLLNVFIEKPQIFNRVYRVRRKFCRNLTFASFELDGACLIANVSPIVERLAGGDVLSTDKLGVIEREQNTVGQWDWVSEVTCCCSNYKTKAWYHHVIV